MSLLDPATHAQIHKIHSDLSRFNYTISDARSIVKDTVDGHDETMAVYWKLREEASQWFIEDKIAGAIVFAARKHKGQTRKNDTHPPYLIHPLGVALILLAEGNVDDPDAIVTAILHDTVEDTDATFEEVSKMFGEKIAGYVRELSDEMGEGDLEKIYEKKERKLQEIEHAKNLSPVGRMVKLADKLHNMRDMPEDWSVNRRAEYLEFSSKILENVMADLSNSECSYQQIHNLRDLEAAMKEEISRQKNHLTIHQEIFDKNCWKASTVKTKMEGHQVVRYSPNLEEEKKLDMTQKCYIQSFPIEENLKERKAYLSKILDRDFYYWPSDSILEGLGEQVKSQTFAISPIDFHRFIEPRMIREEPNLK